MSPLSCRDLSELSSYIIQPSFSHFCAPFMMSQLCLNYVRYNTNPLFLPSLLKFPSWLNPPNIIKSFYSVAVLENFRICDKISYINLPDFASIFCRFINSKQFYSFLILSSQNHSLRFNIEHLSRF